MIKIQSEQFKKILILLFISILLLVIVLQYSNNNITSERLSSCTRDYNNFIAHSDKLLASSVASCEEPSKTSSLYIDLIEKILKLDRSNSYDFKCKSYPGEIEVDCVEGKIKESDISEIFYDQGRGVILVLVPGTYGGSGFKLLKYDVKDGSLEIARREDIEGGKETSWYKITEKEMDNAPSQKEDIYRWFSTPDKIITEYDSDKISLSGITGDAGCWSKSYFGYDVDKNYIYITKRCGGCNDEKEQCTIYLNE